MKADLVWLSVDEDHLRVHPCYASLPPESCITISSFDDLPFFRQSSQQWAVMHNGRLTTSKAASVLGIYETKAAKVLNIPRSLTGVQKANGAYHHLCGESAFQSLEEAKNVLMEAEVYSRRQYDEWVESKGRKIWRKWRNRDNWRASIWTHNYNCWYEGAVESNSYGLRMAWGSIHEPTAVLIAVNYFALQGGCVAECGMFPGEALFECNITKKQNELLHQLYDLGCPIGASPDGLIHHADGTVEVLEVKNHCPFRTNRQGQLYIFDQYPSDDILLWTIPQIQLEMFCVGPHCKSAVLVRLTATKGAVISRIWRDDDFITQMLERFVLFYETFVNGKKAPHANFGFGDMESLLKGIKSIGANATFVERIEHQQVQRKRSEKRAPLLI